MFCRVILALLVPVLATAPAAAVTDAEVNRAIESMQKWLLSRQDAQTGAWTNSKEVKGVDGSYPGEDAQAHGTTALVTYALLTSGLSAQDGPLDKALRFLREAEMNGTYAVALRAHCWAALPDEYLRNLERDARWLLQAQTDSLWDYGPVRKDRVDHSTTQYGILGLWEFSKRGGKAPREVWEKAIDHFVKVQNSDGGWGYDIGARATSRTSMTTAGLTVLYVGSQQLYTDQPPQRIVDAINKGLAWLDKYYSPSRNVGYDKHHYYYLYGIERVALASGMKRFAGLDWFESGAEHILSKLDNGHIGSPNSPDTLENTAFALMFLARGNVPVWITKLQVPGSDWNNRPTDIYTLSRYLSDRFEAEVNWQAIDIGAKPTEWSNAPVAFLSGAKAIELDATQREHLKGFLDHGGLLVANAEGGSTGFTNSIQKLAAELYPDYPMKPLDAAHPLLSSLYRMEPRVGQSILGVSNGARDLIFLLKQDPARDFIQLDDKAQKDASEFAANLYALVTDRGTLSNRLAQVLPNRRQQPVKGSIRVARAQYDGSWNVEPHAWEPLAIELFNRTGMEIEWSEAKLQDLSSADADLVHLAGVERIELTDAEKQAIADYVKKGGTLLVETVGGRGEFSVAVEQQLQPLFGAPATPLSGVDPVISGQGLTGGSNARRVLYRPYSVVQLSARTSPRLAAFHVDDRPAVFISHEDLSLGAVGLKRWGVNGYQPESARQLLTNVLLFAQKQ